MSKRPAKKRVPTVGKLFNEAKWHGASGMIALYLTPIDSPSVLTQVERLREQLDAIEAAHRAATEEQ